MSKARNLSAFISEAAIDASEIGSNAVTTDKLSDLSVTHAKLHTDMDLTSKTVTFADNHISGNKIHGGVISDFASIGIDDNASSTALTITSGGNVGIGIIDPTADLQLGGSNPNLVFGTTGNELTYLQRYNDDFYIYNKEATGKLFLGTANQTRLTVNATGNVGIGATSPEVKLEVNGGADGSVVFGGRSDGGNGNNRRFNLIAFADGGGANYGGGLKIQTRDSVNVFHDRITVQSDGNVGIGTSSPSAKLTVYNGNILLDGPSGSDPRIDFHQPTNTGEGGVIVYNDSDEVFTIASRMATYGDINFATGMNDGDPTDLSYSKMFIRANGNVGIGATNPAAKLHVNGDGGYSWGNGTYTKLGTISRYDMGGYNSGASNVSRQLLYYAYDQVNWNTQYLKVIVRHSYYYTGGEAAYILDCHNSSARQLYNNNAGVGGTPFTFSNNDISGNHRVTSVTFNPGLTYHSYYFTFEWTDGFNASGQTSTPAVNGISFSH